jgi:PEP-CTERM putative exosortase interaction domain
MKLSNPILLSIALSLASAVASAAATLYGSTASGGPGELYILNPATGGVIQDVGPLNDALNANYGVTGLAFNPVTGLLYGSTGNADAATAAKLIQINPVNGLVTVVGDFNVAGGGAGSTMADLAFDSSGNLYGIGSRGGPQLYSINLLTGQATIVGAGSGLTSTSGGGLAISPSGGFFGTPTASRFGTYDSTTGAYSNIANPAKPAGGGAYAALDFDGNVLYGLNSGPGTPPPTHLVTIDTVTGAVTDLGASVFSLDAIAFAPVPEPGTVTLLCAGLVLGLAVKHRRK